MSPTMNQNDVWRLVTLPQSHKNKWILPTAVTGDNFQQTVHPEGTLAGVRGPPVASTAGFSAAQWATPNTDSMDNARSPELDFLITHET